MFKIHVVNNLPNIVDKLDMLNINIQSAVADAVMSAEPEIKNLFDSQYFENTEIEIIPSVEGIGVHIKNLEEDYYYYQNTTGSSYYDIGVKAKEIIANKVKEKFGTNL